MKAEETVTHAIFSCGKISMLWFQSSLWLQVSNIKKERMEEWVQDFIRKEFVEVVEVLVTLALGI